MRCQGIAQMHHRFQGGAFAAQILGPLGVVPDVGLAQFQLYFRETVFLVGVVKDTP